jgi:hypothetical protein
VESRFRHLTEEALAKSRASFDCEVLLEKEKCLSGF